ncbi:MAG: TIGR00266 family protein [Planctomycetota bacterium]
MTSAGYLSFEITQRPDFSLLTVNLQPGQRIFAEPAAMATMDPVVRLKAGLRGGLGKALGRALAGESLIMNTFSVEGASGEISFAAGPLGDIRHYKLGGNTLFLQRGAFLAHGDGVEISAKWGGARGFFSGTGLVLLRAGGSGELFFNSYGAVIEVDVRDHYVVDTGYVVAFEDTLQYHVSALSGLGVGNAVKSFLFGGEGLVCKFSGQGKVWIQTRAVNPFLRWIHPFRRVQKRKN